MKEITWVCVNERECSGVLVNDRERVKERGRQGKIVCVRERDIKRDNIWVIESKKDNISG